MIVRRRIAMRTVSHTFKPLFNAGLKAVQLNEDLLLKVIQLVGFTFNIFNDAFAGCLSGVSNFHSIWMKMNENQAGETRLSNRA